MGGKSTLVSLLVVSCISTSVVMAVDEPFCTSRFDFEEKLLHKVMRIEHAMELLQDEVTKNLTEIKNRQADETFAQANCRCPDTWIRFKGSCYLFLPDAVEFAQAEVLLLSIIQPIANSQNEMQISQQDGFAVLDANRWIGLTDLSIEGVWEWRDSSKADFVEWGPGEPNRKRGENCAALYQSQRYKWVDMPCTWESTPICEKELTSCPPV